MLRRLNSTGRKKIEAGMVSIALAVDDKPPAFTTTLDLTGLDLPGDAVVVVEAQRLSAAERFDLGPVSGLTPNRRSELRELAADSTLQFRIKVVEQATGRLLAIRKAIKPGDTDESGRLPLLTVKEADLGAEPWRTTFDEDGAVLVINEQIPDAIAALKKAGVLQALILPAAFRQVLLRLWAERVEPEDEGDPDSWKTRWLQFATGLAGEPPDWEDEPERWIDTACAEFSKRHNLMAALTLAEVG